MDQVRVAAWASDPIALAGLIEHLRSCEEIQVVPGQRRGEAAVLVFAASRVTPDVKAALRAAASETPAAIVLVAGHVEAEELPELAACHVAAVLPREAIAGDKLVKSIVAAATGRESCCAICWARRRACSTPRAAPRCRRARSTCSG